MGKPRLLVPTLTAIASAPHKAITLLATSSWRVFVGSSMLGSNPTAATTEKPRALSQSSPIPLILPYISALALFSVLLFDGGSGATAAGKEDSAVLLAAVSPCEGQSELLLATTLNTSVEEENFEHKAARLSLERWYFEALKDLRARNSGAVPVPKFVCSKFKVVPPQAVVAEGAIDWWRVHRLFPGITGVLQVSLPSYDRERDRAIVEITMTCGRLCGSVDLIELRNTNGKWERVNRVESATE